MIQIEFLKLDTKKKKKIRNSVLKLDDKYRDYINDNTVFSENDYILFEKKLKQMINKIFIH